MVKKCEWKNGKFKKCIEAIENGKFLYNGKKFTYCPYCGADLRKPEQPN